jgi:hypothetical protein
MPSRVLILIKSESNSPTMATALNSSRPVWIGGIVYRPAEGEFCVLTSRAVSSATMSRVSGSGRASRSSLFTTRTSPARRAAIASRMPGRAGPGRSRLVPVRPWSDVDPLGRDVERGQGVALGGEVLIVGGDPHTRS